jgi:hypothetical protein
MVEPVELGAMHLEPESVGMVDLVAMVDESQSSESKTKPSRKWMELVEA